MVWKKKKKKTGPGIKSSDVKKIFQKRVFQLGQYNTTKGAGYYNPPKRLPWWVEVCI